MRRNTSEHYEHRYSYHTHENRSYTYHNHDQKNWSYAYHNLQESFRELKMHLRRIDNNFNRIPDLSQSINSNTLQELDSHIEGLRNVEHRIANNHYGTSFEVRATESLLDRFLSDAEIFVDDFRCEMNVNPIGLNSYFNEGC